MASIYCLSCLKTGKKYIGSTRKNLDWRVGIHYSHSKTLNTKLYVAMRQYDFMYGLVEEVEDDARYEREAYWIKKLNTIKEGYNSRMPGRGIKSVYAYKKKMVCDMNTNKRYVRHRYRLYAPDGTSYDTTSMAQAAQLLGINKKSMYGVATGKRRQNLGWRAEILD